MHTLRLTPYLLFLLVFLNCTEKIDPVPLNAEQLAGTNSKPNIITSFTNCWIEKGNFNVVGVCYNLSAEWQKIWLNLAPLDAKGKPVAISKHASVVIPTLSDAVPPNGRTSFSASWPIKDFSGKPDTCVIILAGATLQKEGPILVTPTSNGLKMLKPMEPGQKEPVELGWQISGTLSNPLPLVAAHPRLEVLIYDTDFKLWFSTLVNTEDPQNRSIFQFLERQGPLQPKEDRFFTLQLYYQSLPQALKDKKIGKVDILPFEAR